MSKSKSDLNKNLPETAPQFEHLDPRDLRPSPQNPRKHDRQQIRLIAASIKEIGFAAPVIIDQNAEIIAGHARVEAAVFLKLSQVPVVRLSHLTDAQITAYRLADNQLATRATWNDRMVALQLKELSELAIDFDITSIGFEPGDLDFRIQSLEEPDEADRADEFSPASGPVVSATGDLWFLGDNRLYCGDALDDASYTVLMNGETATAAFVDFPYNVKIRDAVGNGRTKHREFKMASGEMSEAQFTEFLTKGLKAICSHTAPGSVIFSCTDWRHIGEMVAAGKAANCKLLNLCVWIKINGGLGSLYRSRHELIFVWKAGNAPHLNNVRLGKHGRNRTNAWTSYPGVNTFGRKGTEDLMSLHPTIKPVALVSDAILDCSSRGDIILDSFLGSGTSILAAEKTGRRGFGIEIDPQYCDTAIERWQRLTGRQATNARGEVYDDLKAAAGTNHG